ncbi:hypothetical protein ACMD2_04706 [Ananas comosus]|uniref:Uncharacterized protein n=1 Tax=Ananas comosus TaxID=4615 RepID=A0A199VVG1_ANACO|nr:hypothetical protein ACMD2_04706 [Ananas comosus]
MQILLKEYLKPEIDIPSFVKQLDKLVEEKRYAELLADYHANQGISRIPPLRLLWQAATAYTPSIFEQFRMEFELFLGCMVYCCGEVGSVSEIAYRAAETMDTYAFMESQSDQLLEQVENILQTRLNAVSKGQQQTLVQNEGNINEFSRKASRKKNKNGEDRCRHQNPLESNKRQKGRQGVYDEANGVRGDEPSAALPDIPAHPRNPPNQFLSSSQFMQTPYVPSHQFGLGPVQGIHEMTQFSQESSSAALPPQPFHSSSQLTQNAVQGCPAPDVHSLQFVASNPQLAEQSTDQRHCTIPLWDFL